MTATDGRPTDEQIEALARLLLSLPSPPGDRSDRRATPVTEKSVTHRPNG